MFAAVVAHIPWVNTGSKIDRPLPESQSIGWRAEMQAGCFGGNGLADGRQLLRLALALAWLR